MVNTVTKTFLELVRIDSPSGYENKVGDFLVTKLREFGAKNFIDKEGNILARIEGGGEPLLLCAHMDTVEPGKGVRPEVKNGVIRSDRTTILGADNKVAIAAILQAVGSVKPENRYALEVIFSVREETDGGLNKFDFSKLKSKVGIVADYSSPVGWVVQSSPWIMEVKIEVTGKAVHAGIPEQGTNALTLAASCLTQLCWGRIDKNTTANIGLVSGGSATNTVPERVFLEGEIRSFSKKNLDNQFKLVKRVFSDKRLMKGANVNIFNEIYCAGYFHDKTSKALTRVRDAIKRCGLEVNFSNTFGGSDANTFNARGIEVFNLADGTKNSHTVNESVSVESLVNLTKVIGSFISV